MLRAAQAGARGSRGLRLDGSAAHLAGSVGALVQTAQGPLDLAQCGVKVA